MKPELDFININGVNFQFADWGGTGTPILFLAGGGLSALIFNELAPEFTNDHKVYGFTRRGHGQSDSPKTGYDIKTLSEDIHQFILLKKLTAVILIGHSMAGEEMNYLAANYPELIRGLVYLDAAYNRSKPDYSSDNPVIQLLSIPPSEEDLTSFENYEKYLRKVVPEIDITWGKIWQDHIRDTHFLDQDGRISSRTSDEINMLLIESLQNHKPDYSKIRCPSLSFYGIYDHCMPLPDFFDESQRDQIVNYYQNVIRKIILESIDEYQKGVTNGTTIIIENSGHYFFLEKKEEVVRDIRNFFRTAFI